MIGRLVVFGLLGAGLSVAQQPAAVIHSGCIVYKNGQFLLQDLTTQEVFELDGPDLDVNVGNRVEIVGTISVAKPEVSPAMSVLIVRSVAPRALPGGCLTAAVKIGAQTRVPDGGGGSSKNSPRQK